jgi:hypothetical protein
VNRALTVSSGEHAARLRARRWRRIGLILLVLSVVLFGVVLGVFAGSGGDGASIGGTGTGTGTVPGPGTTQGGSSTPWPLVFSALITAVATLLGAIAALLTAYVGFSKLREERVGPPPPPPQPQP